MLHSIMVQHICPYQHSLLMVLLNAAICEFRHHLRAPPQWRSQKPGLQDAVVADAQLLSSYTGVSSPAQPASVYAPLRSGGYLQLAAASAAQHLQQPAHHAAHAAASIRPPHAEVGPCHSVQHLPELRIVLQGSEGEVLDRSC
jgi:hypothetical protein